MLAIEKNKGCMLPEDIKVMMHICASKQHAVKDFVYKSIQHGALYFKVKYIEWPSRHDRYAFSIHGFTDELREVTTKVLDLKEHGRIMLFPKGRRWSEKFLYGNDMSRFFSAHEFKNLY